MGKDVTYHFLPEGSHDYPEPGHWEAFWAVAEKFFHDHLGDADEADNGENLPVAGQIKRSADLAPRGAAEGRGGSGE